MAPVCDIVQSEDTVVTFPFECVLTGSALAEERRLACGQDWKPRTLTEIREKGHDSKLISTCSHPTLQESGPVVRILADGVYDMFHWGHAEQFRQIKQLIPNSYLIVGVCRDVDASSNKRLPVFSDEERAMTVINCRYVDEVFKQFPYTSNLEIMEQYKVDLMAHDGIPYGIKNEVDDCYAPFKKVDRFLETQRYPGVSTTDLLKRIIERYDLYKKKDHNRQMA